MVQYRSCNCHNVSSYQKSQNICTVQYCIFFGSRLVKEITYREFQKVRQGKAEAPDPTNKQLEEGKRMKCPLWWTIEALHEGAEAYMCSGTWAQ